ncbi:protein arginine kinase [Oceanobacillus oncorhynchi]|uniref:protein arginine kinase n=1 Tax=Oceanobacillus oncorhynchi TaxID=545501 RepID=UPI0034D3B76D
MTLESFINEAISPWMLEDGPDKDIVMSSRVRLARNFADKLYPTSGNKEALEEVLQFIKKNYIKEEDTEQDSLTFIPMKQLNMIEKLVLVEKHLISPHLIKHSDYAAVLLSEQEQTSIMVNEEDHLRIQVYYPGLQLKKALEEAYYLDDWLEEEADYAFDETKGYLTSCPTNIGTGMRASIMMHLPALVLTKQINRLIPAINQLGLVVRGIYGEGSEARGNIFQISNQITLGKSEEDIVEDLESIVNQLVEHERMARQYIYEQSEISLEDRVFRSYGTLKNSRIIDSKEAATCISNLRLGIDLGIIENISENILNELMVLTQPGFLQHYANKALRSDERDIRRASIIRERLNLKN